MKRKIYSIMIFACVLFINSCVEPIPKPLTISPSPRAGHGMVYDSKRNVSVLFGGASTSCEDQNENCLLSDTWEYDGANWAEVITPISPSARSSFAFGYNPHEGKTVLFGGYADGEELNDTWEYDGKTWILRNSSLSPLYIDFPQMIYSQSRESLILFGYAEISNTHETWEYKDGVWIIIDNKFIFPLPNQMTMRVLYSGLVYNPVSDTILLQPQQNLTFEYDYSRWRFIDGQNSNLPRYLAHSLIYDSYRDKILLINADESLKTLTLWEFTGDNWVEVKSSSLPSLRFHFSSVYDEKRKTIILFGGESIDGDAFNETWEYDGAAWVQR